MKGNANLSMDQQLWLGFGGAAVLLGLVVAQVLFGFARISRLRQHQLDASASRAEAAGRLERAVLAGTLAAQVYSATGSERERQRVESSLASARYAVDDLRRLPLDADAQGLLVRIVELAEQHRRATGAALSAARPAIDPQESHRTLDALLAGVRGYANLQAHRVAQTRADIGALEAETQRGLLAMAAAVLVLMAGTALSTARQVRNPARALLQAVRSVASGDYAPARALATRPPGTRNQLAELSATFGRMALELEAREKRLAAGARFASLCASHLELGVLCDAALAALVTDVEAELGAVYLLDPEFSLLRRRAAYALDGAVETLGIGEGIPGQAARTRSTIVLRELPVDSPYAIRLGFDRIAPRALAAVPMTVQDRVLGVLLLGCLRDLAPEAVAFLEQCARQLAVSVDNALAHRRAQELAVELQDRNRELQARHEEGQRAEQALRDSDRRKDEFLALLSHELRNPLTPVRNNLFLLQRAPPGSEAAAQALAVIDRQVTHLVSLVDDLLDVARINRGLIRLQLSDIDLTRVLRAAAQDAASLFAGRGLRLELRLPEQPVPAHADPNRISQIVSNLLHNSSKFTPSGGQVTLGLDVERGRGLARIWVRDTGVGIHPAMIAGLFAPFAQAEDSLARSRGGLGLGLPLVRGLVELHGGSINGFSEGANRGSQFTVELPLHEVAPEPESRDPAILRAARRVLVIEDNADTAESLRAVLEYMGHVVQTASDGRAGVRHARQFQPEVVFCDIGLPEMDGYAVARALRDEEMLRDTFLVAMTGYALPEDRRRAAEAGFHEHVAKPPSIERLEDVLARAALTWSGTAPSAPSDAAARPGRETAGSGE